MKKEVMIILFILLIVPFILAEDSIENSSSEDSKIDAAYKCLKDKLGEDCSSSLEENIFSLLAIGECKEKILSEALNDDECWPKSNCNIKTTAQAILALDSVGSSTSNAEKWLISKNITPEELIWYLEIESPKKTSCTITYGGVSYQTTIGEDKKLSSSAGSCLTLSSGSWWLQVSSSCYNYEFEISCDEDFLTTLLYKKKTSPTVYVSESITSASAGGMTSEKVDFKCFSTTNKCDYEGTLWAALVLGNFDYSYRSYIPYLITMADENEKFIPEAFLYALTKDPDIKLELLLKQKIKYWDESGDKFYDSAIALLPFRFESLSEKLITKQWLLESQDSDGCWDKGNIRNNAFLLYSIWPKKSSPPSEDTPPSEKGCISSGYYCMSEIDCEGNILDDYTCSYPLVCCDEEISIKSCSEQGGIICEDEEICSGGIIKVASDVTVSGESCCVGGQCVSGSVTESDCEIYGGICRPYGCESGEKQEDSYSCDYGDICCVVDSTYSDDESSDSKNLLWVWILGILIILVILAIIFRDRLRSYYYKIRHRPTKPKPGMPGGFERMPHLVPVQRRIIPRRILPPPSRSPPRLPEPKKSSEIDDVLKRLKEMSKK
jgi:hypothetical protein